MQDWSQSFSAFLDICVWKSASPELGLEPVTFERSCPGLSKGDLWRLVCLLYYIKLLGSDKQFSMIRSSRQHLFFPSHLNNKKTLYIDLIFFFFFNSLHLWSRNTSQANCMALLFDLLYFLAISTKTLERTKGWSRWWAIKQNGEEQIASHMCKHWQWQSNARIYQQPHAGPHIPPYGENAISLFV